MSIHYVESFSFESCKSAFLNDIDYVKQTISQIYNDLLIDKSNTTYLMKLSYMSTILIVCENKYRRLEYSSRNAGILKIISKLFSAYIIDYIDTINNSEIITTGDFEFLNYMINLFFEYENTIFNSLYVKPFDYYNSKFYLAISSKRINIHNNILREELEEIAFSKISKNATKGLKRKIDKLINRTIKTFENYDYDVTVTYFKEWMSELLGNNSINNGDFGEKEYLLYKYFVLGDIKLLKDLAEDLIDDYKNLDKDYNLPNYIAVKDTLEIIYNQLTKYRFNSVFLENIHKQLYNIIELWMNMQPEYMNSDNQSRILESFFNIFLDIINKINIEIQEEIKNTNILILKKSENNM